MQCYPARMSAAIRNERTKLTANALDRASTACLAIGVFAPLAGLFHGSSDPSLGWLALSFGGWLATAIVLHYGARRVLGGLKP
jgi:hypothetical protein